MSIRENATRPAVGYVRLCSDKFSRLDVQTQTRDARQERDAHERAIRDYCNRNSLGLGTIHSDVVTPETPAADLHQRQQAIDAACQQAGSLVVVSLSQFTCSALDLIRVSHALSQGGADLVAIDDELDTASQGGTINYFKLMTCLRELQHERFAHSMVNYGLGVSDDLEHISFIAHEQAMIRRIVEMNFKGMTFDQIADELNRQGAPMRNNRPWDAQTVKWLSDNAPTSRWQKLLEDEV